MKSGRARYLRDGLRGEKLLRRDLAASRESSDRKARWGAMSSDAHLRNDNSRKEIEKTVNRSREIP
jgi:hypothetical protein